MLGMQAVTTVALTLSLTASHRTGKCTGFDYDQFWADCLARPAAANHLAQTAWEHSQLTTHLRVRWYVRLVALLWQLSTPKSIRT